MKLFELPKDALGNLLSDWINKEEGNIDIKKDYLMSGAQKLVFEEVAEDMDTLKKKEIEKKIKEYDIIIPKNPELKSSAIYLNKKMLKNFLTGDNKEFFKTVNFQRRYAYEHQSILWSFEKRQSIGDYTMIFPNPDYHTGDTPKHDYMNDKNNAIGYPQAKNAIDSLLDIALDFPQKRKFIRSLKIASLETFIGLVKPNSSYNKTQFDDETIKMDESQAQPNEEGEGLNAKRNPEDVAKNILGDLLKDKDQGKVDNKDPLQSTPKNADPSKQEPVANEEDDDHVDGIDFKKLKTEQRIIFGGGYYRKEKDFDTGKEVWKRTENKVCDFLTLYRKIIYIILSSQGLVTREFVTSGGEYITLVIYIPTENVKKIAQKIELNKTLDFSLTDLMSLEPIDLRNRPFRTNKVIYSKKEWDEQFPNPNRKKKKDDVSKSSLDALEETISYINVCKKINLLLTDKEQGVHFKKMVRNIEGIWDRNDNVGSTNNEIYEHCSVPLATWRRYLLYLQILKEKFDYVKIIREILLQNLIKLQSNDKTIVVLNNKLKTKDDKVRTVKILAELYKTAMISALNEANEANIVDDDGKPVVSPPLKNIWQVLNIKPFEANTDFVIPTNRNRPRIREFLKVIWKIYYERNGEITYFTKLEVLKCINWLVSYTLNIPKVKNVLIDNASKIPGFKTHISDMEDIFFPLHEPDRMFGFKTGQYIMHDIMMEKSFFDKEQPPTIKIMAKEKIKLAESQSKPTRDDEKNSKLKKKNNLNLPFLLKENLLKKPEMSLQLLFQKQLIGYDKKLQEMVEKADIKTLVSQFNQLSKSMYSKNRDPLGHFESIIHDILFRKKIFDFGELLAEMKFMLNEKLEGKDQDNEFAGDFDDDEATIKSNHKQNHPPQNEQVVAHETKKKSLKNSASLKGAIQQNMENISESQKRNIESKIKKSSLREPLWPLMKIFTFNFFTPWKIQEQSLRDYYGGKLALFIKFISYYISAAIPMALLGIPVYCLQSLENLIEYESFKIIGTHIFCYSIVMWTSIFPSLWERRETLFSLKYAQNDDDNMEIRGKFTGKYVRSIINDQMNDVYSNENTKALKVVANYLITLLIISFSIALSIIMFILKRKAVEDTWIGHYYVFDVDQLLFNVADVMKTIVFDLLYYILLERLINWENHKFVKDYEKNYIYLGSFFFLVNTFAPVVFITYINENYLGLECVNNYCFAEASLYFSTFNVIVMLISVFLWTSLKTRKAAAVLLLGQYPWTNVTWCKKQLQELRAATMERVERENKVGSYTLDQVKARTKDILLNEHRIYDKANLEIERQIKLKAFEAEEVDETTFNYLLALVNFAGVSFFGSLFPLSFIATILTIYFRFELTRTELLHNSRRPDPKPASSIGYFKDIISFMSNISIITNSFILSFTIGEFWLNDEEVLIAFVINLVMMFFLKFVLGFLFPPNNTVTDTLRNREKFIVGKVEDSLSKSGSSVNKIYEIKTNFTVYGKPEVPKDLKPPTPNSLKKKL